VFCAAAGLQWGRRNLAGLDGLLLRNNAYTMGSFLGVSESARAEFSFCTPCAPASTYTFKLLMEGTTTARTGPLHLCPSWCCRRALVASSFWLTAVCTASSRRANKFSPPERKASNCAVVSFRTFSNAPATSLRNRAHSMHRSFFIPAPPFRKATFCTANPPVRPLPEVAACSHNYSAALPCSPVHVRDSPPEDLWQVPRPISEVSEHGRVAQDCAKMPACALSLSAALKSMH
jgi:hypothetical protein